MHCLHQVGQHISPPFREKSCEKFLEASTAASWKCPSSTDAQALTTARSDCAGRVLLGVLLGPSTKYDCASSTDTAGHWRVQKLSTKHASKGLRRSACKCSRTARALARTEVPRVHLVVAFT
eukprot:6174083-Pleurochrysis_carterae.AAC.2